MSKTPRSFRFKNGTCDQYKHSSDEEDNTKKTHSTRSVEQWSKLLNKHAIGDATENRRMPIFSTLYKKSGLMRNEDNLTLTEVVAANIGEACSRNAWKMNSNSIKNNNNNNNNNDNSNNIIGNKRLSQSYLHGDNDEQDKDVDLKSDSEDSLESKESNYDRATDHTTEDEVHYKTNEYLEKPASNMTINRSQKMSTASITALTNDGQIDYITLLGLALGLFISKGLHYMLIYFNWVLRQIFQLRQFFLKDCNILEFFQSTTSNYSFKTRMWLLPIMCAAGLFYIFVTIMNCVIRLLLKQVPDCFVSLVHKIYQET